MLLGVPPRTVGPYEILSVIGRGGIGTVYRARQTVTGQPVALKLLGPPPACDPTAARRLALEFEALRGLDHPNIVRVFAAGVFEGYSFLAMELVEGLDLRTYLSPVLDEPLVVKPPVDLSDAGAARPFDLEAWADEPAGDAAVADAGGADAIRAFARLMEEPETDPGQPGSFELDGLAGEPGPAPWAEQRPISPAFLERLNLRPRVRRLEHALLQVCEGLAYVHERGLVHRDLKPANIMVDDARRVRIMDFGLVKVVDEAVHITLHGKVVGTYRYMAPEQAQGGPVDHRADLYSLGVILFELVCGRPPFAAQRPGQLWQDIISRPAPAVRALNPGADPRLARIAERLLAKNPGLRFQRAEEILREMRS